MAAIHPIAFKAWPWSHWMQEQPEATAIIFGTSEITWRQLCDDVSRVHLSIVTNQHTIAHERVAIVSHNNYACLITMLAAWQNGWQTLMLNPTFSQRECNEIIERVGINVILNVVELKSLPDRDEMTLVGFNAVKHLTLTLTSGSTGAPKAVVHTANNHLASASGLLELIPFKCLDCWLLSLPLFHVSGLGIVWRWLIQGAMLKLADIKEKALITALEGCTHASLVPTQLQCVLEQGNCSSLHAVLLGGTEIPQSLVDEAERIGIQCWCGYGMTEMASTITAKRANGYFSVGDVLPNRELRLYKNGEVMVKGETLSPGYMVRGNILPLTDDWFATKDKGCWNEATSELQIIGRLDNMFICGGENVQPENLERILSLYSGISQIVIFPIDDDTWGKVPIAIIEGEIDSDEFLTWAKTQVLPYQCPKAVYSLPNNLSHSGIKLSRKALLDWLLLNLDNNFDTHGFA
ncbi:o-succinylbenzoate--CoA ligase [Candidatus Enterovibrio escicola]|uniref:O-succinylbenzoic acid--CoA ligase n=1 Tax=Candidatus Enterovibrio escicola TaxID=1927127 RepID=A0A2A5T265_9GAMM|nr:o-succinylbenzoate--CoA ligase [Candidatus Enterovibrio escacola]PCS22263.1 O-succinylbenzoic acid--CoA ligase [Candidatus Enterovibrio escacola]